MAKDVSDVRVDGVVQAGHSELPGGGVLHPAAGGVLHPAAGGVLHPAAGGVLLTADGGGVLLPPPAGDEALMEVEAEPPATMTSSSYTEVVTSGGSEEDEEEISSTSNMRMENIMEVLDGIEEQVEKLRLQVARVGEEKESLLTTLEMLANPEHMAGLHMDPVDREEVDTVLARLSTRLSSITAEVTVPRSSLQQEALHLVNEAIHVLIQKIQMDPLEAGMICRRYLSATGSHLDMATPPDERFEKVLLGCTVEDQKSVRSRLIGLQEHIKAISSDGIVEVTESISSLSPSLTSS